MKKWDGTNQVLCRGNVEDLDYLHIPRTFGYRIECIAVMRRVYRVVCLLFPLMSDTEWECDVRSWWRTGVCIRDSLRCTRGDVLLACPHLL